MRAITHKKSRKSIAFNPKTDTLLLRTVSKDMTSHGGTFTWKKAGLVECKDWDPRPVCGGGLHGLERGIGDGLLLDWSESAMWLVFKAKKSETVQINSAKSKARRAWVIFCGAKAEAIQFLIDNGADASKIIGGQATASGDRCQATASGYYGQATASGDRGQATASGHYGQATASGYRCQATASGDSGQATASGYYGQATASGDYGQATASGDSGQATASGDSGQAIGKAGASHVLAIAGLYGQAEADDKGVIAIKHWDAKAKRWRLIVGYIGEDDIEPRVRYCVNEQGNLAKVTGTGCA